jgi:hypothetical protein
MDAEGSFRSLVQGTAPEFAGATDETRKTSLRVTGVLGRGFNAEPTEY